MGWGVLAGRFRICQIFVIATILQSDYNRYMNVSESLSFQSSA